MAQYNYLSDDIINKIQLNKTLNSTPSFGYPEDKEPVRRYDNPHDKANLIRSPFIRDVDKILNCPYYNRYSDKTQVFSLYKNDDITHRSLHVQLVSRIARTIGKVLNLNLDLIEAISLGHDIGHTPFGHLGERLLDEIYRDKTGRRFAHNVHSVRVLDKIFPLNISLPTLNGIVAHNGELELDEYSPKKMDSFIEFDEMIEKCYLDIDYIKTLTPSTLEGCVMRVSDIIAYLGKDRHDAEKTKLLSSEDFSDYGIGKINAEIVNNLIVNIVENSYGKNYIKLDELHFEALKKGKRENYAQIYGDERLKSIDQTLRQMMSELYEKLLFDLKNSVTSSPIYRHHITYINKPYYKRAEPYENTERNQIVVDYIASMTDDYFIDLYEYLFPNSTKKLRYVSYFR